MKQSVAETMIESGISPLELFEYPVLSCSDGAEQGIFTELCINSLELGVLCPAQYRVVTNRNIQSIRLCTWAFRRIVPLLRERDGGWISFYIPAKALMRDHLRKLLESEQKKAPVDFSGLVAELSSEILYEDAEKASEKMTELNKEFGIRFMLSEFGDEYCPVLRLPQYPVDFVLLDSSVNSEEALGSSSVASCVKLAKQCGKKVLLRSRLPENVKAREASPDYYIPENPKEKRRDG
ncbi:MAG: EAL domain-containing protein [Clostridia bacterium]|nr:EAL domain-containing protein [Clostridia bacterium]